MLWKAEKKVSAHTYIGKNIQIMQLWTKIRDMLSPLKESLTPISHPETPCTLSFRNKGESSER